MVKPFKLSRLHNPVAGTTSISGSKASRPELKLIRAAGIAGLSVSLPSISAPQSKHAQKQTRSFATIHCSCSNSGSKRWSQRKSQCVSKAASLTNSLGSFASVLNNVLAGVISHPPLSVPLRRCGEQGTQGQRSCARGHATARALALMKT